MNSEADKKAGTSLPSLESELGSRLLAIIDHIGTRQKASEVAGRSTDQLGKYVRGTAEPPFLALARLCIATGTSMEWLATGQGAEKTASQSQSHDLSPDILSIAMELIDERLHKLDEWLPRRDYAELLLLILEMRRENMAFSRIRAIVDAELKRVAQGDGDAGRERLDREGAGRADAGSPGGSEDGNRRG